jgi:hypothetical protein
MGYNRALDLMAMSLAATQINMPVRAAKFMHEAAAEVSASAAIEAIFAANKKKPAAKKKKAKASTEMTAAQKVFAELGLDEDEAETCETELPDDLEAALAEAGAEEGEEEEAAFGEDEKEDAGVVAAKAALAKAQKVAKARKALAEAEGITSPEVPFDEADDAPGGDLKVDVPEGGPAISAKSTASFARALRNLAARQK